MTIQHDAYSLNYMSYRCVARSFMVTKINRILFACTWNAVRSPIAQGIMNLVAGNSFFIDSVGVRLGVTDSFAITVMEEIGVDISNHQPKTFEQLIDRNFDIIISLSPEAQHKAVEMTRDSACKVEFWHTMDPSIIDGNRDVQLSAFRQIRDELSHKLNKRFGCPAPII